MIEIAHVATGAVTGRFVSSPLRAAVAGVVMHGLMDVTPHGEINDRRWEIGSTLASLAALALRFGPSSPEFCAAVGSTLPDAEHILPRRVRPQRGVFPTHRFDALHRSDTRLSLPATAQVVLGGMVLGALIAGPRVSPRRVRQRRGGLAGSLCRK